MNKVGDSSNYENEDNTRKTKFIDRFRKNLAENVLLIATIAAVLLGIGIGFILREFCEFNKNEIKYFNFPGELFLRMLKFLILPLIGSSLISGIAGLGTGTGGKIAARSLVYYFLSTFTAVVIGIILVVTIRPGEGRGSKNSTVEPLQTSVTEKESTTQDTLLDLVRNLFPDNIVEMGFRQYETKLVPIYHYNITYKGWNNSVIVDRIPQNFTNGTDGTAIPFIYLKEAVADGIRGLNVLGLILFCFVFGGILAQMGKEAEILIKIFEVINEASVRMIRLVMIYSPIGVFSLVLATILEMQDPAEVFQSIALYMVTVIVGLIVHGMILLPLLFFVITRKNILTYTKNLVDPLLIAIATASSTAALPSNLRCTIEKNKINKNIANFVLPVGATINMNGTALYEAVAVIFIAQITGKTLSFIDISLTSLTATLASIGAASVPSAGLVTMLIILNTLGLPSESISLIYTVDWFLDRLRTTINVWGDAIGAGIIDHLSRKDLEKTNLDEPNSSELPKAETKL